MSSSLAVCLLHEDMLNKEQRVVTTSLTLIDIHDISRSAKTYGLKQVYVAHPAKALQELAGKLAAHWKSGYGASYNPDRKAALDNLTVVNSLSEIMSDCEERFKKPVKLIATSAKYGSDRITYKECQEIIESKDEYSYLLMLGTGWGMTDELMSKADYTLAPISGPTPYNHLSVRSACAIMLDRLLGNHL